MGAHVYKKLDEVELILKDLKLENLKYRILKEQFLKLQADRRFISDNKHGRLDTDSLNFDYFE